jgi:hypothetical protein
MVKWSRTIYEKSNEAGWTSLSHWAFLFGLNFYLIGGFCVFFTSIDFFRKKLMCNGEYFFIIEVMKIFQQFAKAFL